MDVSTFCCTLKPILNTFYSKFTFICYWYDLGRESVLGFMIAAKTSHTVLGSPFWSFQTRYWQLFAPPRLLTGCWGTSKSLNELGAGAGGGRNRALIKFCRTRVNLVSFQTENGNNSVLRRNVRVNVMDSGCFRHFYSTGFYLKWEYQQWENHSHAEFITAVVTQNHG